MFKSSIYCGFYKEKPSQMLETFAGSGGMVNKPYPALHSDIKWN